MSSRFIYLDLLLFSSEISSSYRVWFFVDVRSGVFNFRFVSYVGRRSRRSPVLAFCRSAHVLYLRCFSPSASREHHSLCSSRDLF